MAKVDAGAQLAAGAELSQHTGQHTRGGSAVLVAQPAGSKVAAAQTLRRSTTGPVTAAVDLAVFTALACMVICLLVCQNPA